MTERLHKWVAAAASSFERGEAHEENLRYLLGPQFSFEQAWEQTLAAFEVVARQVAEQQAEPLIVRAVVPLEDAEELVVAVPELGDLLNQVSHVQPPMLVVIPPRVPLDRRRFEEYRVALTTDLDAVVRYSAARSLDHPHDGIWTRSLTLDASADVPPSA